MRNKTLPRERNVGPKAKGFGATALNGHTIFHNATWELVQNSSFSSEAEPAHNGPMVSLDVEITAYTY
ncbi:hypothetical protein SLA2020_360900 [Shorea laevis]